MHLRSTVLLIENVRVVKVVLRFHCQDVCVGEGICGVWCALGGGEEREEVRERILANCFRLRQCLSSQFGETWKTW